MRLLRLTNIDPDGKKIPICLNPAHIVAVSIDDDGRTEILLRDSFTMPVEEAMVDVVAQMEYQ